MARPVLRWRGEKFRLIRTELGAGYVFTAPVEIVR